MRSGPSLFTTTLFLGAGLWGCTGVLSSPEGSGYFESGHYADGVDAIPGGTTGNPSGSTGGVSTDTGAVGQTKLLCTEEADRNVGHAALTHLTREEFIRTVKDLVGVDASLDGLPADDNTHGYDVGVALSSLLVESYADQAERLAAKADVSALLPCDPAAGEDACAAQFIDQFARRGFRRALETADQEGLFGVFEVGRDSGGFETGVRLVVEAVLQSPSFLYHVHAGADAGPNGMRHLSAFALADRLAYLVWGSMPDDTLLDRAETGALATADGLVSEARRMLEARPDAATASFQNFYRQWLGLDALNGLARDTERYPEFTPGLADDLRESLKLTLQDATWNETGGMESLFSTQTAYVNERLAGIFGVSVQGEEFVEVDLDPAQRRGILTHPALLAALAKPNQSDPVLRGKFVRERLLCGHLPPPPPDVATTPPDPAPGLTTRERFAEHSSNDRCVGCHKLMDPIGFGLENFDALGQFREFDEDLPVDAAGEILATKETNGAFEGGVGLSEMMGASAEVRDCIASQYFSFAMGRNETDEDACSMNGARKTFAESQGDFRELMVAVVQSDAFRFRSAP